MTKAAETQAARVERRLMAIYPAADGYDVQVHVEGYSLAASVWRDNNRTVGYVGDKWTVAAALETLTPLFDKLDRDEDGNPPRDEDGNPLDLSQYA